MSNLAVEGASGETSVPEPALISEEPIVIEALLIAGAPVGIDPMDSRHTKLGDVVIPVMAQSTQPTSDNPFPPHDALIVPEGRDERAAMIDRLLALFGASLGFDKPAEVAAEGATRSTAGTKTAEATKPTKPTKTGEIVAALRDVMPDPASYPEAFESFMRNRCHGVLEMLKLLVSLRNNTPPADRVRTVVRAAKYLGAGHTIESSGVTGEFPPNTLGPELHNRVLCQRVRVISSLVETAKTRIKNVMLIPAITARYKKSGFSSVLAGVFNAYADNIEDFAAVANPDVPELIVTRWMYSLCTSLNCLDLSDRAEAHEALESLYQNLKSAGDMTTFRDVIDSFARYVSRQIEGRVRQTSFDFSAGAATTTTN